LRGRIGDAAFFGCIRNYYAKHKYGVVHKDDFKHAMERSSGQDLDHFFVQWLGR
jgi:aminopeptidase N